MSKKLGLSLAVAIVGVLLVSSAMAMDYGYLAWTTKLVGAGQTAGTVLNPEGKGDALIFPYYDVRPISGKSQENYFFIFNEETGDSIGGVAAKIRFREWDKSEEVFDADIWLSRADVWVGKLEKNTANGLTRITSSDWVIVGTQTTGACNFIVDKVLTNGFDFLTDKVNVVGAGYTKAEMTNMGYFEVIGEELTADKVTSPNIVGRLGTCNIITSYPDAPNTLMGFLYLVRVADGVASGYNANAFANFSMNLGTLFRGPGALIPDLSNCEDTLDQIDFEISKEDIFAGYSIEEIIAGKFSMVVTFPTKHFHYQSYGAAGGPYPRRSDAAFIPGDPFQASRANEGEIISVTVYDRHENKLIPETSWWSPPPSTPTVSLPFEVNIIGLYKGLSVSVPTGSRDNIAFPTGTFDSGWIWILFYDSKNSIPKVRDLTDPINPKIDFFGHLGNGFVRYYGLPTLGLAIQEFANLTVGAGAYYGEITPIFYEVEWNGLQP